MHKDTRRKLFLVDGSALFYRSHFAFSKNPLITSRGENVSAIFGFLRLLFKIEDEEKPDYFGVVFDTSGPTFRHKAYPAYKATREKMPDELRDQLPRIRETIAALNMPFIEVPGYEADDALATLAVRAAEQDIDVFIVTGDKDLMQLVNDRIKIYSLRRSAADTEIIDTDAVIEKMGVRPDQIRDYLALIGDTSDNVPGVPKVGPKTAIDLLKQYDTLDGVLAHVDEITKKAVQASLRENVELAKLSYELVTIDLNTPVELDLDKLTAGEPHNDQILTILRELEFNSLLDRFSGEPVEQPERNDIVVRDAAALDELCKRIRQEGRCTFDLETTDIFPVAAEVVGFSFAFEPGEAWYVPIRTPKEASQAFREMYLDTADGSDIDVLAAFSPLFENPEIGKNGQNAKYDILVLKNYGMDVQGLDFDTMLASYLLNPSSRQHNLDALALEHFNLTKIPTSDLLGKGKNQITMREVDMATVAEYACEDADVTERLRRLFAPRLEDSGLQELAQTLEIPLVNVLATVEHNGVALDVDLLGKMSEDMERQLAVLEQEIYRLAGEEFNIGSPKQLAVILFEKLELPVIKKTKTGYSTDASVLEKLAHEHELPEQLLAYREISKLKSTYVDSLPKLINPRTGRVHTSYNQTVAATGRLSSSDPNLQNIPIRTEAGRQIRRAFVPGQKGWQILDADYSQIELRVMAHLSGDENLIAAFRNGEDIHAFTASRVFNEPLETVSADLRRRAKEINFGIMYGMGPFGLASRLNIPQAEATQFIKDYFEKYPGVQAFITNTLEQARKDGYVTTLLQRRRMLPDIHSNNRRVREFAERIAINTPIQGTAADMIKLAMLRIDEKLRENKLRSMMIMQVHDELVFEVPDDEIDTMKTLVETEMANALPLAVPIKIGMGVSGDWLSAH